MREGRSESLQRVPERGFWRQVGAWALVAAFCLLLPVTVLSTSSALLRGPGPVPFPSLEQAAANFAAAGMHPMVVPWLRLATGCFTGLVLAGAALLLFRQHR